MYKRQTLGYVKLLKETFGENFHLHLYTSGYDVSFSKLKKLQATGLDEIRFHITAANAWETLEKALELDWDVGIEVPVIPEQETILKEMLLKAEELGVKFVNLNEFEVSERNEAIVYRKGYHLKKNAPTAIDGSEETALRILEFARKKVRNISIHYCSAATKNRYQLQNRWKRRARSIKEPYEKVDENGFLVKGIIVSNNPNSLAKRLRKKFKIAAPYLKIKNNRIETSVSIVKRISKVENLQCYIVKQLPIWKPWDVEKIPLINGKSLT